MNRHNQIIERICKDLEAEGYSKNIILSSNETGYGDHPSFFDVLIDLKLEGKEINNQAIWENMKKQILFLQINLNDASKEYLILSNKYRDLENNYNDLLRESKR